MPDLSIIIVNYNSCYFLQLCLDALKLVIEEINTEVIVIDNASSDNSCSIVLEKYPFVRLVESKENLGFGKANNRGIEMAVGHFVLLLNPDTIVQKATLQKSIEVLTKRKDVAAVGVKMLDGSGFFLPESKRGLPLPKVAFYKAFGLAKFFPKSSRFARYYLGHLSSEEENEVEVLAGAYMMCRADVLKKCGGFDEDFFMYGEDIDLSYRLTQRGYKLIYLPQYPIIHFKGESAKHDAVWAKHFYGAMELFSSKHFNNKGKMFRFMLNCGIAFRKSLSLKSKEKRNTIDLSKIHLYVTASESNFKPFSNWLSLFKKVSFQLPDSNINNADAVLFTKHFSSSEVINIMKKDAGKKQFFFAGDEFVLTSPNSDSQGEVYSL